ncbi:MAG: DUF3800 domain-containing protein [Verrucomicrobia bacterium]|nr:DUF3800 domain-containing protein [Verrucomicrobiota bacterium]
MSVLYSDYIVYVDESGDHSLTFIDQGYPVFALSFCIFEKQYYAQTVTPAVRMLKFSTFGHDMVILHEHEIRKGNGAFKLLNKNRREVFFEALNLLIAQTNFTLIGTVIDKYKLKKQEMKGAHVYHLAMQLGLEKLYSFLQMQEQEDRLTHIICKARGRVEDLALELEFRRVCSGQNSLQKVLPFDLIIADKKTNSEGLQFADMIARPIGLTSFRPNQANRAVKILERKFFKNAEGIISGHGFHIYP